MSATNIIKKLFQNYPRLSNSVVYGTLYVGAEFSQQVITQKLKAQSEQRKSLDYAVLGRYWIVGSVINSNILYTWYKWLDKKYVGTHGKIVVKKVLLDQFVMTPPLYVIFYVTMSLMEGKTDVLKECREKFVKTFTVSCLFWLPAQTINFLYVPKVVRVVYTGMCSFAWVNILCWIKRSNVEKGSKVQVSSQPSFNN